MERRELLAGIGGLGVFGVGGALAIRGVPSPSDTTTTEDREPISVETVDAPGSQAGTVQVPGAADILVVDFFATTCEVCKSQMGTLRKANDAAADATFLSVTLESDTDAIRDFWTTYDANWLVGMDTGIDLYPEYEVVGTPTTVVMDAAGTVHWRSQGRKEQSELLSAIDTARAATE